MSGWLAVWTRTPERFDPSRWRRAVAAGAGAEQCAGERIAQCGGLATWRRSTGEFPHNGDLRELSDQRWLAWVGQTCEDEGDTSEDSMRILAEGRLERAAQLNGPFAAAVLDADAETLTIWTDRFSHYPVYIAREQDLIAASTSFEAIASWVDSPRLDLATVDLLLRCGEVIDRRTLLENVEAMPGGTRLEATRQGVSETRYWRLATQPDYSLDFDSTARDVADRMRRSVRRVQRACPSLCVPLSGGLDSRFLLGLCESPERIPSLTWGEPGCRDIEYGARIAKRLGSSHTSRTWDPEKMTELWEEGIAHTAGCFIIRDMFVLPFVGLLSTWSDAALNGLAGDALLGTNFLRLKWILERRPDVLSNYIWRWRSSERTEQLADQIMKDSPRGELADILWKESILGRAAQAGRPIERVYEWLTENRCFRFTNCGTSLLRSRMESHAPFCDRDVVDRLSRVPVEYKLRDRLYLRVLKHACPVAAASPWQRTGMAPSRGFLTNMASLAFHRTAKSMGKRIGCDPFPKAEMARPEKWFRSAWRDAAEEILLSEQSLSRGLFDADGLRAAWAAHQNGEDLSKLLSAAITVELFCRRFVDGASDSPSLRGESIKSTIAR